MLKVNKREHALNNINAGLSTRLRDCRKNRWPSMPNQRVRHRRL